MMKHFIHQYIFMNLRRGKNPLFFVFILGVCFFVGCMAKSGHKLRFRESSDLAVPTFGVSGVSTGNFTFSFVGDIHLGGTDTSRLRTVLQAARDNGDAFIIFLGDMVDKGVRADFETFKAQVNDFGFQDKAIYVIGNHDIFDEGWSSYRDLLGPSHYEITFGNCRFLVIDSADGIVGEEQTEWLEARLKETGPAHTFILSHYMPLIPGQRTYLRLSNETEATHLMKMMSRFGVKAWLGSHYHSFIKQEIENVTYLVAGGGGGRRMEPLKDFFYVRATVQGSNLSYQPHTF